MRPDDPHHKPTHASPDQADAALDIVRHQVDAAFGASLAPNDEYQSHDATQTQLSDEWQQYHSAWQDYYQKYYERYYVHHIHKTRRELAAQPTEQKQPEVHSSDLGAPLDKDAALSELKQSLITSVQNKAETVRGSRHFVPITAAVVVMLLFGFLQYNQVLIANVRAYVSPGAVDPQNIIVDPSTSTKVDPTSTQVLIPKINVDVPVDYSATPDYKSQMAAMKDGLAYFGIPGADSKPGQIGNTPIAGHSSNDVLDRGNYKFIFAQLDKLNKGDTIYASYKGTRYTYVVTKKQVVKPTDIDALVYDNGKPMLTLITCTPLGTALNRLLVSAEQVNPSPSAATKAPTGSASSQTAIDMPGTAPTFFERLFGWL